MYERRAPVLVHALAMILLLSACGKPKVEGNVTDAFGKPLEGASVTVEGTSFSTTTGDDGDYAIQFVPGQFKVKVKKDGYTTATVPFTVAESTNVPAATVELFPRPTEPGIYYIGKDKLEPLPSSRLRREEVRNPIAWLPGSTRYLLQSDSSLELPEGEARFIDTVPKSMQLARATSRSGLILDTAHGDAAGVVEATSQKVGDEDLKIWSVQLKPGVYGWVELEENILGGAVPGQSYYGFSVGDAPWFTYLGTYTSTSNFDPNATQQERAYSITLWRDPVTGIVGHVDYPVMEADTPTGRIENARYDAATGAFSFRARVLAFDEENEVHEFTGKLGPDSVDGTFKRYDEGGTLLQTQQVSLKKQPLDPEAYENTFENIVAWQQQYSDPILRFRGPR
jgi:hypothetical protein